MSTKIATKKANQHQQGAAQPLPSAVVGLLSKRQVCQALGNVSIRTLSEMISRGVFPRADVTTFGVKLPRWSVQLVNRWVRDHVGEA